MKIEIKTFRVANNEVLDYLTELEKQIFDKPYSREKIEQKLARKKNVVALIALENNQPVGFKVGFEMTTSLFYSWIGGVVSEARGKGIARMMMVQQHEIAKDIGYDFVKTESENRFKAMLILNLKFGFDIVGVRTSDQYPGTVITLEKKL